MKLWGGRFKGSTSAEVDDFHSSIHFDWQLYKYDIKGSIAHAAMLGKQNIIPMEDSKKIIDGLLSILADIEAGKIEFSIEAEDIHMNVETILIERIGDAGKRLHTGRSRNDQVALDTRMYTMAEVNTIISTLKTLLTTLSDMASMHLETIMPGYTHMQKAQPITLAHHLMAYFEMFKRDVQRLCDLKKRIDVMPLGSGALAGTTYPLDRQAVADELGFSAITINSLDAVSDRDFIIELLSASSIIMMHLSRFCEEIILWSSHEFKFIDLDDTYSTGSSIMPQKKNPDMAELIRGKTGRVYGHLMGLLTIMKGLPLAYNKDMQEDKECLFDTVDTVKKCLNVFTGMISTAKFNADIMKDGAKGGFTNATDAADYLVKKGLPFREAHEVIGKMVLYSIENKKSIDELTMDEFKGFSYIFEDDVYDAVSLETCVEKRNIIGGPAKSTVMSAIEVGRDWMKTV